MSEDEARAWLVSVLDVPRETMERLERFAALLLTAATTQNLIGATTVGELWSRHIADSAQLLLHAPADGPWIDVGTGAGFPGLIVALLGRHQVTLVESRPLRAAFLNHALADLALTNATVRCGTAGSLRLPAAAVLSARAVAPLPRLFATALHLTDARTVWLLPKGRRAASELAAARKSWQGAFAMQPSVTDPEAAIVIARQVAPRTGQRA